MRHVEAIMERDVVTIPPNAPVSDLVRRLGMSGITGLPVVDEQGFLVGVVSSQDVVRLARELGEVPEAMRWGLGVTSSAAEPAVLDAPELGEFFAYQVTPDGKFIDLRDRIRELPSDVFEGYRVEDVMTRDPVTIDAEASIPELARQLRAHKVRRALVLDSKRLVGIVTATDILDAVAEG